jgi:hypothetical protein
LSRVRVLGGAVVALLATSCVYQPGSFNPAFVGIEPVANSDPLRVDLSAGLLTDLAAMPNLRVIDLRSPRNAHDFAALSQTKLRLFVTMEPGPFCLRAYYTVAISGQIQYASGMVIQTAEAPESTACIDLFATRLYGDLVRQVLWGTWP